MVGDDHCRQRPRFLETDAPLLRLRRLLGDVARNRLLRLRHATEILRHQPQRFLRIEVADQHRRRVVRHVVGLEEVAHVANRRGLQILHAADHRVLIGMDGKRLVADDFLQTPVRLVLNPHPPLFLDDLTLGLERLVLDAQRRHAIGLEPEHERQVLRGHRLPEDGRVFGGVGVALPADARDVGRMSFGFDVLRSLEHHVLEEVCEPGPSRTLVLRPDVIPDLEVNDRRGVIFEEDHVEAVGQRGHRVVESRRSDGRVRRREGGENGGNDDRDRSGVAHEHEQA